MLADLGRTIEGRAGDSMRIMHETYMQLRVVYAKNRDTGYGHSWQWKMEYDYLDKKSVGKGNLPDESGIVKGIDVTGLKTEGVWRDEKWTSQGYFDKDDPKNPYKKITLINERVAELAKENLCKLNRFNNLNMIKPQGQDIDYDAVPDENPLPIAARTMRMTDSNELDLF